MRHAGAVSILLVAVLLTFSLGPALEVGSRHGQTAPSRPDANNQALVQLGTPLSWEENGPTNSTRLEILGLIADNPGIYLRSVSEELGLAVGDVQYHLYALVKDGDLTDRKVGRYRRFFESGKYTEMEQKVISALREGTTGRILLRLAGGTSASHMQLAAMLGLTSQGVTWQMGRLRSLGIVEVVWVSGGRAYQLTDDAQNLVEYYLRIGRVGTPAETPREQSSG